MRINQIITKLFFLLLWLGSVAAQAGTAAEVIHGKGLLWRIESNSVAPSYIYGTMHTSDERVLALASSVKEAFRQSRSFTMELIPDEAAMTVLREKMFFHGGGSLDEFLGESLYSKVAEALGEYGMEESTVRRLKPWMVIGTLSTPPSEGNNYLDQMLYLDAQQQKKSLYGLESAHEQVAVLDGMSREDQVALVELSLENFHLADAQFEEMVRAYVARDLAALVRMDQQMMSEADQGLAQRLNHRLIDERNLRMVQRMWPRLMEGNAFIAVGALHLPGEKGILRLLEHRGYRVVPLY